MSAIQDLYDLQVEADWQKQGRSAKIRQLKDTVADEEEGRKASLQILESNLESLTAAHAKLLAEALTAFEAYVLARERLNPLAWELAGVRGRARRAGLELPPSDGFSDRVLGDYEYRKLLHRSQVALSGNW